MKHDKVRCLALAAALLPAGAASATAAEGAAAELHRLFDEAWQFQLRESPLFATSVGEHRYDDRLPSMTMADLERRAAAWRGFLERLRAIDRARLEPEDRISYEMFAAEAEDALAEHRFQAWRMPLTVDSGFHTSFARLPAQMTFTKAHDYENYAARLRAFPAYVDQQVALMRRGLEAGFTLPRVILEGYEGTIAAHVVARPEDSVFDAPYRSFPPGVPAADHERLRREGRAAIMDGAVAGYQYFLDFMTKEYIPGARSTTGARDLPEGEAYYRHLIRHFTTLDLGPEEVHRIGLGEVRRIRAEMDAVIREVGFHGDFAAFLEFLRTDTRFYAKSPEGLLKEASFIAKRMDAKLPSLFKTLPRLPYGVEPVPDHMAPKYTAGRYVPAPVGGTRAGTYWVNTYALESRPLYALEALSLHEAVPGHHLQNALRAELTGLPEFRRFASVDAYGEGWGLYSERLGMEAGFYRDPYSNFGRLTYEMWRACRLVVDTGLHALGWSRQQALDYLASNTALSLHEVRTEIDRYISWPGQALAYKMGELKIRELRALAEKELGTRFDVRAFHDVVLLSGPLPLPVLEEKVKAWIASAGD
jgi:uncharacterized protein (DUF885 family)